LVRPEGVGTWTYFTLPFDARERFGRRGQIQVRGTVSGEPFGSPLLPHGDGRHYLVVPKALRDKLRIQAGNQVQVTMDRGSRASPWPADLRRALNRRASARSSFAKMALSHRRAYLKWIQSAKNPETRQRRIELTVEMITAGKRLK